MEKDIWIGQDERHGLPSLDRPDAPKAKSWSLEAIGAVDRPYNARVSPDGSQVSFTVGRETSDIWVVAFGDAAPIRLTTGRDPAPFWEDDPATWSPDGSRLAFSADGSVRVVAVSGGLPVVIAEGWSPQWISNDELVFFVERDDRSRLVRCRVDDGWPRAITPPGGNIGGAVVSPDRSALLYVDFPPDDRSSSNVWIHDLETGSNRQLTDEPGMHDLGPAMSPDGARVAFSSERSGWREVHLMDADGSNSRQLTEDLGDFSNMDWHRHGTTMVAVRSRRGIDDLVTIDIDTGAVTVVVAGGEWSSVGWAGDAIVAVHEGQAIPPRLVTVTGEGEIESVFDGSPASIRAASYVPYVEAVFPSFDGLEIHGFLFKPRGDGPFPAVVYPHGGPTSVYGDQWDGHAQYFVEKGYAWFGINFRGSTTYGREFERANRGVWGVADTEDCLAAADHLAGLDWIDAGRIGIFGASYGSYLALASLAMDPQYRFACGVAKYGDSDIATSWAQGDRGGREDLEKMMGTPAQNREAYRAGSPLWMVERIERPILVAHGEQDDRVHPDQSAQLVDELKRLGKAFEYVTYPTEAHGLLRSGPHLDFYRRLERFLDWHLM